MTDRPAELSVMLALAQRALERNLAKVWVGFEGLGADFPAPIGWLLHLGGRGEHLGVSVQRGDDVSAWTPDGRLDAPAIEKWIDDHAESWVRAPTPGMQARDAELMVAAVANGWTFSRRIEMRTLRALTNVNATYKFEASNWFYNQDGHPDNRDTGAEVSRTLAFGCPDLHQPRLVWALDGAERIELDDALALVRKQAPWHAPVARYDEDAEEWVL